MIPSAGPNKLNIDTAAATGSTLALPPLSAPVGGGSNSSPGMMAAGSPLPSPLPSPLGDTGPFLTFAEFRKLDENPRKFRHFMSLLAKQEARLKKEGRIKPLNKDALRGKRDRETPKMPKTSEIIEGKMAVLSSSLPGRESGSIAGGGTRSDQPLSSSSASATAAAAAALSSSLGTPSAIVKTLKPFAKGKRKEERKKTRGVLFHLLRLAIYDRNAELAARIIQDLSPKAFVRKKPFEANMCFLLAMANRLEATAILMMAKGFPTDCNAPIFSSGKGMSKLISDNPYPSYFLSAVALGLDTLVRLMIKKRANLNQAWFGLTPLLVATIYRGPNAERMLKLLLEQGANPAQDILLEQYYYLVRLKLLFPTNSATPEQQLAGSFFPGSRPRQSWSSVAAAAATAAAAPAAVAPAPIPAAGSASTAAVPAVVPVMASQYPLQIVVPGYNEQLLLEAGRKLSGTSSAGGSGSSALLQLFSSQKEKEKQIYPTRKQVRDNFLAGLDMMMTKGDAKGQQQQQQQAAAANEAAEAENNRTVNAGSNLSFLFRNSQKAAHSSMTWSGPSLSGNGSGSDAAEDKDRALSTFQFETGWWSKLPVEVFHTKRLYAIDFAVSTGNMDTLELLLSRQAARRVVPHSTSCLLLKPALEMVLPLIITNASLSMRNPLSSTPLHLSARIGSLANVAVLLHWDSLHSGGRSRLKVHADKTVTDRVERAAGVQGPTQYINMRGYHGFTPLHEAASMAHWEVAAYLLKHGADPELANDFGDTAEQMARKLGLRAPQRLFAANDEQEEEKEAAVTVVPMPQRLATLLHEGTRAFHTGEVARLFNSHGLALSSSPPKSHKARGDGRQQQQQQQQQQQMTSSSSKTRSISANVFLQTTRDFPLKMAFAQFSVSPKLRPISLLFGSGKQQRQQQQQQQQLQSSESKESGGGDKTSMSDTEFDQQRVYGAKPQPAKQRPLAKSSSVPQFHSLALIDDDNEEERDSESSGGGDGGGRRTGSSSRSDNLEGLGIGFGDGDGDGPARGPKKRRAKKAAQSSSASALDTLSASSRPALGMGSDDVGSSPTGGGGGKRRLSTTIKGFLSSMWPFGGGGSATKLVPPADPQIIITPPADGDAGVAQRPRQGGEPGRMRAPRAKGKSADADESENDGSSGNADVAGRSSADLEGVEADVEDLGDAGDNDVDADDDD